MILISQITHIKYIIVIYLQKTKKSIKKTNQGENIQRESHELPEELDRKIKHVMY